MAIKAWIHKETGLPCFYLDGPDAGAAVYDGERLINPADTANAASAFCDPFAPPGVATTYTAGTQRFTLTRRGEGYAVTSLDSRTRAVVSYIGDDARGYDTRATATDINARRTPVIRWAGGLRGCGRGARCPQRRPGARAYPCKRRRHQPSG